MRATCDLVDLVIELGGEIGGDNQLSLSIATRGATRITTGPGAYRIIRVY
jgi:hypothetical protein